MVNDRIIISFLNGYFIGNINPTFSDKPKYVGKSNAIDHEFRYGLLLCLLTSMSMLYLPNVIITITDINGESMDT